MCDFICVSSEDVDLNIDHEDGDGDDLFEKVVSVLMMMKIGCHIHQIDEDGDNCLFWC